MRLLRIAIGLLLALFSLGYMSIGAMFMTGGPPYETGAGRVLAPRPLRAALAAALGITAVIGLGGGLYALSQPDLVSDAAHMLLTVVLSTAAFSAAILRARFFGEDR
jgi:hypothetical protein